MSVFKEFRDFIARGNVIDLAVAVVIGGAFGKIVTSFVNDIIMPPIGWATGGVDFSALKWVLKPGNAAAKVAEVSINYGTFINTIIQFLIIAAAIFVMLRVINRMQKKPPEEVPAPPAPTPTEALLAQIRDLLANRSAGA
ncbi:MAG: large-conductance mechanosensitive channel protein MscL [Caulobacteraceae bacterium]